MCEYLCSVVDEFCRCEKQQFPVHAEAAGYSPPLCVMRWRFPPHSISEPQLEPQDWCERHPARNPAHPGRLSHWSSVVATWPSVGHHARNERKDLPNIFHFSSTEMLCEFPGMECTNRHGHGQLIAIHIVTLSHAVIVLSAGDSCCEQRRVSTLVYLGTK